ncbi:guanine deaminase-like [Asterias rubens]|uniref:guanine deaminase-like n=1 Tax=Asterias rubens TaxID=7604 RepID=UPI0014550BD7|nr:guanine deaminase-like [Asterias rubens]
MSFLIFQGTLVHAESASQPLKILHNHIIGVNKNKIVFIEPEGRLRELSQQHGFQLEDVQVMEGQFLIPGFVDTHIHAPQYVYTGTAMNLQLLEWLNKYTFPTEAKFANLEFAADAYRKVVHRTLKNGTTTACYFATIHKEASLKLAEIVAHFGQRAFVGKVNMDANSPEYYVETTEQSFKDTEWFIKQVQCLNNPLVTPIITPRFAVSCTVTLMKKLANLAELYGLPIQTHISENKDEISLVKELFPECSSYADVYQSCGLVTKKSVFAHSIYLDDKEIEVIKHHGSAVSHCPCSNFMLRNGILDLRKLWDKGIKLGLGTDVSGGYSPSMLSSIRQSVIATNVHKMQQGAAYNSIDYKELFYLATLGGSQVLGLEDRIGNFVVGKEFDALLVNPKAAGSPFDVFNSSFSDSIEDIVQKFLFLGDDRNIQEVYVSGRKVIPTTLDSNSFF